MDIRDEDFKLPLSNRQKMLGDLVRNILPTKPKPEVISLLGEEETTHFGSNSLQYWMGKPRTGMAFGPEFLILEFDEDDIYSGWRIYSD